MKNKKDLINFAYSHPKYWGKHIVIIKGKIFSAKTGEAASRLLEKLIQQYPQEEPLVTYVPKADALILFLRRLGLGEKKRCFSCQN